MTGVHVLIGLGEAVVTALVLAAIARTSPELLRIDGTGLPRRSFIVLGALIAVGLAAFLSPFASAAPDGLEWIAERFGFAERAASPAIATPMTDYGVPGLASSVGGTLIAGSAGTALAFGLSWLLARVLARDEAAPAEK
jgi:cobalt/nickel transport system permease protein